MASVIANTVIDVEKIRAEFPILNRETQSGTPVIYLDSAATSQKPRQVIDIMARFYEQLNANIHRGIHQLAEESTQAYEGARSKVARFLNINSHKEVIFTRNTTEAINLVAYSWGRTNLHPGDIILLTEMEHHSNLVPWQILAAERDLQLEFIPVTDDGLLDLTKFQALLQNKPRLVAFTHMSNVLGTINPVVEMTKQAHDVGAVVLIDGAQSVPHLSVDITEIGADFYAFSAHKMCGPTGIGVLYGREELLSSMPPFLGGGDMIRRVHYNSFSTNELPYKFEAGTPAIAEAIGLGAAIDFLEGIGLENVHRYEQKLISYALERFEEVPGITVFGPKAEMRGGVASFTFDGIHPHDIAQILDTQGIAVRAGHHCAMPLHERYNLPATTRASFYIYTTEDEIDHLVEGLYKVKTIFG